MVDKQRGDKHFFGTAKVGTKGQIVIPKEAREIFDIQAGDQVMIVGEVGKGLGLAKVDPNSETVARLVSSIMVGEKMSSKDHDELHDNLDKE